MPQPAADSPTWQDFQHALCDQPRRWLVPAGVVCLIGIGVALVKPSVWEASQALVVRDEAIGSNGRPGRFVHQDDMKTVQETMVELAKSRPVLEAALRLVPPPQQQPDRPPAPVLPPLRPYAARSRSPRPKEPNSGARKCSTCPYATATNSAPCS